MPRRARTVFSGVAHHVTQRGNRREDVFFSDEDRLVYLAWLHEYCVIHELEVLAYCLMSNHVHLVAVPASDEGLQRVLKPLHMRYAQRVNRAHDWKGAIFGKVGTSLAHWMVRTCGLLFDMWSATPCVQVWCVAPRRIAGQVRLRIAANALTR